MIEEICDAINNDFTDPATALRGAFRVRDGRLDLAGVPDGQYVRVRGSAFNDGIRRCPLVGLTDETFEGEVLPMRPPKAFMKLVAEIEAWVERFGDAAVSPFAEEDYGRYRYKKAQSVRTAAGGKASAWETRQPSWQSVYGDRLRRWRRLSRQ